MKAFFKALWATLCKPWCWSLIAIIIVSLVIAFGGEYVAIADNKLLEPVSHRVYTITTLFILWMAGLGLSYVVKQKRAQAEAQKAERDAALRLKEQVREASQSIRAKFLDALETIKRAKLYGRLNDKTNYQLPWYLVLGPQSAGKTSLLDCSGLDFPLNQAKGQITRNIGASQHVEWYFANHAVLLDSAGRYFDQQDPDTDPPVWQNFLSLLRNKRRRRPLNGMLLTVSVETLQNPDENQIEQQARYIRERLQEVRRQLSSDMPVYLILTKADKIAGFDAFFSHLSREEMDQVVGATFNQGEGQQAQQVKLELEELLRRLNAQIFTRLHTERDQGKRAEILQFPRQLGALVERLALFCELAFSETRYHQSTNLRGLYLTSVPEPSSNLNESTREIGQHLGMTQKVLPTYKHQRGFFIRRLLEEVIFPNSELATLDAKFERKVRWKNRLSYAAAFALVAVSGAVWTRAFLFNHNQQELLQKLSQDYRNEYHQIAPLTESVDLLPVLDTLYQAATSYDESRQQPSLHYSGLSQDSSLTTPAMEAYQDQLRELLLPRIASELEQQINANQENRDYLTNTLSAYLMLEMQEYMDKAFMLDWMTLEWSYRYAGSASAQARLKHHFAELLKAGFSPVTLNQNLVAKSRQLLRQADTAQLVYQNIQDKARASNLAHLRFGELLGSQEQLLLDPDINIPGLYTQKGYQQIFVKFGLQEVKALISDNWVLGSSTDLSPLELRELYAEVENLYFRDYILYWQDAINQLEFSSAYNLHSANQQLTAITSTTQPIMKILLAVRDNTTFIDQTELAAKAAGQALKKPKGKMAKLAAGGLHSVEMDEESVRQSVTRHFNHLNMLIPDGKEPVLGFKDAMVAVSDLNKLLFSLKNDQDSARASFVSARKRMIGQADELDKLRLAAKEMPKPVAQWLTQMADNSWEIILEEAQAHIQQNYAQLIHQPYQLTIAARYPFANSEQDTNLADFNAFFHKGGAVASFYQNTLAPFVTYSHDTMKVRLINGKGLNLSAEFLHQFANAIQIKNTFYTQSQKNLSVGFSLSPFELDASAQQAEFNFGANKLLYRHGPRQKSSLQWPTKDERQYVSFVLKDLAGTKVVKHQSTGPWALFRLLDSFKVDQYKGKDVLKIDLQNKGMNAQYLLHAERTPNPFDRRLLNQFTLPESIS